jgi:seryl-tRNA synthetase
MLDINLFRVEKGGNPEIIRESQRRRFANVDIVDEIIAIDKQWRQRISHSLSLCVNFATLEFFFLLFSVLIFFFFSSV